MTTRKAYVDAAKFLGILLVLMNHIELKFPFVNFYGGMFYVPVFFVAAGLTYYNKEEGLKVFAAKKARRLLVPYFICNGFLYVFFMAKDFLAGKAPHKEQLTALIGILYSRNSLYIQGQEPNVYFMTILNSPTWFLTAMFLTYLLLKVSFRITKGKKRELFLFALSMFVLGALLHYFCPVLLPWSLECIPLFYCYMVSGYFIREEGLLEKKMPVALILAIVVFFLSCEFNGSANISVGHLGKSLVAGMYNGIFSSFFIIWLLKQLEIKIALKLTEFMAGVGKHTLTILCYHMLVFAFGQGVLQIIIPETLMEQNLISRIVKIFIIIITTVVIILVEKIVSTLSERRRL